MNLGFNSNIVSRRQRQKAQSYLMSKQCRDFNSYLPNHFRYYSTIFIAIIYSICNIQLSSSFNLLNEQQTTICNPNQSQKIIHPMVVVVNHNNDDVAIDRPESSSIPLTSIIGCPNIFRTHFSGFNTGDRFVIDLIKNKRLISDKYFQIIKNTNSNKQNSNNKISDEEQQHTFINLKNHSNHDDHCHYHGYVNDNLNSISAISIVDNKLLSGFFHYNDEIYFLHNHHFSTILSRSNQLCQFNQATGIKNSTEDSSMIKKRSRRDTKHKRSSQQPQIADNFIKHEPFQSNSSSLYVELLVVHDHSQYLKNKGNASNIAERTMQIVNIMNAFYRQLNIFITLVGVVLWTEKDEIELTEDGDATLTNFLKYRYEKLLPKYHHDNAQLITSIPFNDSVVGKALKGPICTSLHSGGVNTDHSNNTNIIAVTIAHELGHNIGMEHDEEDKCTCPDEKCIMSASSSSVHPKYWSSCSKEALDESKKKGLLDCLVKKPERIFGPICGNGFVEEGEDCDLGELLPTFRTSKTKIGGSGGNNRLLATCTNKFDCKKQQQQQDLSFNPCCDRQTCKFLNNATCAQGSCCDLVKCSVYNGTEPKICRPKKTECDFEESCDGKSEYCPPDVYYHNGIECSPPPPPTVAAAASSSFDMDYNYNRSRAFCYDGACMSHESQCKLLWGSNGVNSQDICYEQNVQGNSTGNCGYNRRGDTFKACEPEDALCGMLHCVHNQEPTPGNDPVSKMKTGKLKYAFESGSVLTVSYFSTMSNTKFYCNGAIIDAGPGVQDPGLVPNGAYCDEEKMCVNQRCTPVYDILYKENWCPSDCNGNGICDNTGTCHCNDGTIGTSCFQFFSANFHLSLLLYIIMFFLPIIMIIVLTFNYYKKDIKIWWFLHRRKLELKRKDKELSNQKNSRTTNRVLSYDKGTSKLTISDPIPLNQQNINRPFYEPQREQNAHNLPSSLNRDPWMENNI